MNKMYEEYLKNHAYVSYNKQSTYDFELSEERAKCIANKYDSLTCELQKENKKQKEVINKAMAYICSQMIAYDDGEDCGVDCECDGFKLLDILKGSD